MGLADYYKNYPQFEVNLLMVGEGVEKPIYEQMVKACNLGEHVKFLGRLTGSKLEDVYNITDIGACSFGRYKSGIDVIGDLKSREFMAKGIPMICGCSIDVLKDKDYDYSLYFPNDNSTVDINRIVEWYENLLQLKGLEELTKTIRNSARNWIDYSVTFNDVVNQIVDNI